MYLNVLHEYRNIKNAFLGLLSNANMSECLNQISSLNSSHIFRCLANLYQECPHLPIKQEERTCTYLLTRCSVRKPIKHVSINIHKQRQETTTKGTVHIIDKTGIQNIIVSFCNGATYCTFVMLRCFKLYFI